MVINPNGRHRTLRIAYFGGSFDPPHYGHAALAQAIIENHWADKVEFVVAYSQPFKQDRKTASFEDRLAMTALLVREIPKAEASDFERALGLSPSYTCEVLAEYRKCHPGDQVILLIGEDSLQDLHKWHRAEELVESTEFLIYPRKGYPVDETFLQKHWSAPLAAKLLKSVKPLPFLELSSTEIRNAVAKCKNTVNLIPGEVEEYIKRHHLYQKEQHTGV